MWLLDINKTLIKKVEQRRQEKDLGLQKHFRVSTELGKSVKIKEEILFKSNVLIFTIKMRNRKLLHVFQCLRRNWIMIMLFLNCC